MQPIRVLIRKKKDREHLVLYYVDPVSRREHAKSAETADRSQAERAAALWEQELERTRGVDGCGWEFFRSRFEDEHVAGLSTKSQRSHATAMNHFERVIDPRSVRGVTASDLSRFAAVLRNEGYPPTTIHSYLGHIRVALRWAEGLDLIQKSPRVPMPKLGKRKMMKGRPITWDELQAMIAACTDSALKRFLELLWWSGFRLQEAMRLSWDDGDIQVRMDGKPYPHVVFALEAHKAREDCSTPIAPDFHAWLSATPVEQRHGRVAPLVNSRGQLRDWTKVSVAISHLGKAARVFVDGRAKPASAHDIRRSFGTRWASQVRPLTLQRLMRHAHITTTLKYYIGLTSADAGQELWNSSQLSVPNFVPTDAVDAANSGRNAANKTA